MFGEDVKTIVDFTDTFGCPVLREVEVFKTVLHNGEHPIHTLLKPRDGTLNKYFVRSVGVG